MRAPRYPQLTEGRKGKDIGGFGIGVLEEEEEYDVYNDRDVAEDFSNLIGDDEAVREGLQLDDDSNIIEFVGQKQKESSKDEGDGDSTSWMRWAMG